MRKRINPNRRPATQADVARAKKEAQSNAVCTAWAIMFTVMRDKYGWGPEQLQRLWYHVEDLSDSVASGYVSVQDLIKTLEDEADIHLR